MAVSSSPYVLPNAQAESFIVWDVKPDDPQQRKHWVELKTSADVRSEHEKTRFERKLLKFWIQSFLLGVPKIIVGFRTDDEHGRLVRVGEYETTKIPALVKQGFRTWDSQACLVVIGEILKCGCFFQIR